MKKWFILFITALFSAAVCAQTTPTSPSQTNQPNVYYLKGKLDKINFGQSEVEFFSGSNSATLTYDYIAKTIEKKNQAGATTKAESFHETKVEHNVKLDGIITDAKIYSHAIEFYSAEGSLKIGFGFLLKSIAKKALTPKNLAEQFSKSKDVYCFTAKQGNYNLKAYRGKTFKTFKANDLTKLLTVANIGFVQDEQGTIYELNKAMTAQRKKQFVERSVYVQKFKDDIAAKQSDIKRLKREIEQMEVELKNIRPYTERKRDKQGRYYYREKYRADDERKMKHYPREITKKKEQLEKLQQEISKLEALIKKIEETKPW